MTLGFTTWNVADALPPSSPPTTFDYGTRPLTPLMGDWDGDGDRTPGTYEAGVLKLSNAIPAVSATITVAFGDRRGFPVAGDFNNDGFDDVAIYFNGLWQLRIETGGIGSGGSVSTSSFNYGPGGSWPSTWPVAGDWDGIAGDGIGTYTYATGEWRLRQTADPLGTDVMPFFYNPGGTPFPVTGDWDGDGVDTVGGKAGTSWQLNNQLDGVSTDVTFAFGASSELALVGGVPAAEAIDDAVTVAEDSTTTIDVRANDTNPGSITGTTNGSNGLVSITGGGTAVSYAPSANYCNNPPGSFPDTFTYTLAGGSTATVSVKVTCTDDPPVAVDDAATVAAASTGNEIDVLLNDTDIDGDLMQLQSKTNGSNGTVTIIDDGAKVTYTPTRATATAAGRRTRSRTRSTAATPRR